MTIKVTQINERGEYIGPSAISRGSTVAIAMRRALGRTPDGRRELHLAKGQQITLLVIRQD